ncbi:hypothetical protein HGM15179_008194 [Zosterops borbonicus]|uniref:Uncharacterized protein n=1 Tax=Zosterops borbonicus TaxID=364589 RepID=A0A8K1GHF4_9PASS|nr:hypothetical protein HGM15179_008194 [Zosterops borbonicus]
MGQNLLGEIEVWEKKGSHEQSEDERLSWPQWSQSIQLLSGGKVPSKASALSMRTNFRLLRTLDENGHLTNSDIDKVEVFNAFFVSIFNMSEEPRGSQGLKDHDCENLQLPVKPEIVQDLLLQLDPYKSMGPNGIHTRILRVLTDVISKTLLLVLEQSWESREIPADWS